MTPVRIDVLDNSGVVVATLDGDVDIATAHELGDELLESVPNDASGLVLELSAVPYVDSAGIRMLFSLARKLETCRQALGLCLPEHSPLQRLFKITNMGEVATICSDLEECLEGVRGR